MKNICTLPKYLDEQLLDVVLSLEDLIPFCPYADHAAGLFFTEVFFVYCPPQVRWRFMGASVNHHDGLHTEELVSSIFRSEPTADIDVPWSCIFAFCETALCSSIGRVVPPFVRLAHFSKENEASLYVPFRSFDYKKMRWSFDVHPLSHPA
jgi:hypothetical protein